MKFHEVANLFPMMSTDEYEALKSDIEKNGLLEPIWTYQQQIIDGRNRYNVCLELGIEPEYREWNGEGDLVAFVVSLNLIRRHLNETQRGMVAARVANMGVGNPTGNNQHQSNSANLQNSISRAQAADLFTVSERTVNDCAKVINNKNTQPEIVTLCDAGKLAASAAASIADKAPEFQKKVAEKIKNGDARSGQEAIRLAKSDIARTQRLESAKFTPIHNNIVVGDFWTEADKVADNSLSLIFTDPPYLKEDEFLLPRLADFAARKLAPGGSILFYIGTLRLPIAFEAFRDKLRYWWTTACVHSGKTSLMVHYGIRVGWKPILWFVKETRFDVGNIVIDTVSGKTEKQYHDWQQAEEEAQYWIDKLCPIDGIVCDPFLGSGTTAAAANKLKRKWVGFEINPETALIASGRLEDHKAA